MAKSSRSKVKQMHRRNHAALKKPALDARITKLHNSLNDKGAEDTAMTIDAPQQAVQKQTTETPMVDLTVNKLAPINAKKMNKAPSSKVVKSTSKAAKTDAKRIKINLTSKKRVVSS